MHKHLLMPTIAAFDTTESRAAFLKNGDGHHETYRRIVLKDATPALMARGGTRDFLHLPQNEIDGTLKEVMGDTFSSRRNQYSFGHEAPVLMVEIGGPAIAGIMGKLSPTDAHPVKDRNGFVFNLFHDGVRVFARQPGGHTAIAVIDPTGRQLTVVENPATELKTAALTPKFRTVAPMAFEVEEECSGDEVTQRQR